MESSQNIELCPNARNEKAFLSQFRRLKVPAAAATGFDMKEERAYLVEHMRRRGLGQRVVAELAEIGVTCMHSLQMLNHGHFERLRQVVDTPAAEKELIELCCLHETREQEVLEMLKARSLVTVEEEAHARIGIQGNLATRSDMTKFRELVTRMKTSRKPLASISQESERDQFARGMRQLGCTPVDFERVLQASPADAEPALNILLDAVGAERTGFRLRKHLKDDPSLNFFYDPGSYARTAAKRAKGVKMKSEPVLVDPAMACRINETFSCSKTEDDSVLSVLKQPGHGFKLDGNLSFKGVEVRDFCKKGSHCQMVLYAFHPTKQASLQTQLNTEAISSLLEIALNLGNDAKAKKMAMGFLEEYGSHTCMGPITFGGMYCLVAEMEASSRESAEPLLWEVLQEKAVKLGMLAKGPDQLKFSTKQKQKVQVKFYSTLGYQSEQRMELWNTQLHLNQEKWVILDYGRTFYPIWQMVLHAHSSTFKETTCSLSALLQRTWNEMTGHSVSVPFSVNASQEQEYLKLHQQLKKEYVPLLPKILKKPFDPMNVAKINQVLGSITEIKKAYSEISPSVNSWQEYVDASDELAHALAEVLKWAIENGCFKKIYKQLGQVTNFGLPPLCLPTSDRELFQTEVTRLFFEEEGFTFCENLISVLEYFITHKVTDPRKVQVAIQEFQMQLNTLGSLFACPPGGDLACRLLCIKTLLRVLCANYLNFDPDRSVLTVPVTVLGIGQLKDDLQSWGTELIQVIKMKHRRNDILGHAYLVYCALKLAKTNQPKMKWLISIVQDTFFQTTTILGRDPLSFKDSQHEVYNFCFNISEEGTPNHAPQSQPRQEVKKTSEPESIMKKFDNQFGGNFYSEEEEKGQEHSSQTTKGLVEEAYSLLQRRSKIHIAELRKIDTCTFFTKSVREATDGTMIKTEVERPQQLLKQLLMKNPDTFKLQTQENYLEGKKGVHGLDILCSLLIASEHNSREILVSNMMVCLQATPLMLPTHEVMVYPYQNKSKSWAEWHQNESQEWVKKDREENIFLHKAPVISFIRACDNCCINKSELINSLFCSVSAPSFISIDHTSTYNDKRLSKGLIEMIQYCPEQNTFQQNQVNEMLTLLNLRGNAHEFPEQVKFLKSVSDMIVVVANTAEDFKGSLFVLADADDRKFLWVGSSNNMSRQPIGRNIINKRFSALVSRTNENQLSDIRTYLANFLQQNERSLKRMSLKEIGEIAASSSVLTLDLNKSELKTPFNLAQKFRALCEGKSKAQIVPMQGPDLWGSICSIQKQRNRLSNERKSFVEITWLTQELELEIEAKRKEQLRMACQLNEAITFFIDILCNSDSAAVYYFVEFVVEYLNERSRKELKPLRQKYSTEFAQHQKLISTRTQDDPDLGMKKLAKHTEICEIGETIMQQSFGFEHLIRECGQIYESLCALPDIQDDSVIKLMPKKVAEQLLLGNCIELMDGENSFIAINWMQAILKELDCLCGSPPVNVQSIIGEQSSGKSTFLNALYNSKFAVAAERCTKGIYVQILELDESVRQKFNLESRYLINLDTEGLRSPELQGNQQRCLSHDNEMATLIISIADQTILNTCKEGLGQMKDILEIAANAILRIRSVQDTYPLIKIIQQKEQEMNPEEHYQQSIANIQNQLDEETVLIAKTLKMQSQVKCFNDVIPIEKDREYIKPLFSSGLQNSAYSIEYLIKAHEIKDVQLKALCKAKHSCLTFSQTGERITALWHNLLKQNYAFSFRNNAQIVAHQEVEALYLRKQEQLYRMVEDESRYIMEEIKSRHESLDTHFINEQMDDLKYHTQNRFLMLLKSEIDQHIQNNPTIGYFSDNMLNNIEAEIIKVLDETKHILTDYNHQQNLKKRIDMVIDQWKQESAPRILEFYRKTYRDEQLKEDSRLLNQQFKDKFWPLFIQTWHHNFIKPEQRVLPWNDFRDILQNQFKHLDLVALDWVDKQSIDKLRMQKPVTIDASDPVEVKQYFQPKRKQFWTNQYEMAVSEAIAQSELLQEQVIQMAEKQVKETGPYSYRTLQQQILDLKREIEQLEMSPKIKYYKFTSLYKVKTIARYASIVIPAFEKRIQNEQAEWYLDYFSENKVYPTMNTHFNKLYNGLSRHDAEAKRMAEVISSKVEHHLSGQELANIFLNNKLLYDKPEFKSKPELLRSIMRQIMEGKFSFNEAMMFIRRFDVFLDRLVTGSIIELLSGPWFTEQKNQTYDGISSHIEQSFQSKGSIYLKECIAHFLETLRGEIRFSKEEFSGCDLGLDLACDEIRMSFGYKVVDHLKRCRDKFVVEFQEATVIQLAKQIADNHIGCTNNCPLCGVVCVKAKGHKGQCYANSHSYAGLLGFKLKNQSKLAVEYNCLGINHAGYRVNGKTIFSAFPGWIIDKVQVNSTEISQNAFYQWMMIKYQNEIQDHYAQAGWYPRQPRDQWGQEAQMKRKAEQYVEKFV